MSSLKVLVDECDRHLLKAYPWCMSNGYVVLSVYGGGKKRTLYLHRIIMDAQPGQTVEHRNHAKRDCRRANLRLVTNAENLANRAGTHASSGVRGVYRRKDRAKWMAAATVGGKNVTIGYFDTVEEAAKASHEWRLANMPGYLG